MSGIVINSGSYWGEDSLKWALKKLAHRGSVKYSYRDKKIRLYLLGKDNSVIENNDLILIALNTKQKPLNLFKNPLLLTERKKLRDSLCWSNQQIVVYNKIEGNLNIIQGQLCPTPFYFCCSGLSILGASEIKAFTNVEELNAIRSLENCSVLSYNILSGAHNIEKIAVKLEKNESKILSYDKTASLCRELVTNSVENLLTDFKNPPPVCLSGGIDSCIIAYLVKKLCDTCKAFVVWFYSNKAGLPSDLLFARSFAGKYGIELAEIMVNEENLLMYLEDSIFTGETFLSKEIEDALYYYPLSKKLSESNYSKAFHGAGSDRLFAGFKEYLDIPEQEEFWNYYTHNLFSTKQAFIYEKHFLKHGIDLLLPFKNTELIKNLWFIPKEYKIRRVNDVLISKAVLRDAFKKFLPEEFIMREKGIPRNNNNLKLLLNNIFQSEERKKEFFKVVYDKKLKPAQINGVKDPKTTL